MLLAPYLRLLERARVGPWQLVPFNGFDAGEVVLDDLRRPVERFVEAYRLPEGAGSGLGAIIFPSDGHAGSPFDRSEMPPLHRALLAGTVADNPAMAAPEADQSSNAGHEVATSENAVLFGHPIGDGESYVIGRGVLVHSLEGHHAPIDENLPKIEPPVELPKPVFGGGFDAEVAGAAHAALGAGDVGARRLGRALDWYGIALSNSEAVTLDVRVGAARSALEVLTDPTDPKDVTTKKKDVTTKKLVRAYGKLLRDADTEEKTYSADDVFWAKVSVWLTPDEWWMTRLCELRNAIVHGDEVVTALWHHDGHHQLMHIHDRLIGALKVVVAEHAGDSRLRLSRSERERLRRTEKAAKLLRGPVEGASDDR